MHGAQAGFGAGVNFVQHIAGGGALGFGRALAIGLEREVH
jgi:hypothetical protein